MLNNPNAKQVVEDYLRFGQEVPESLVPPPLHDVELDYWQAFWELGTDRRVGKITGPIPWSSIERYASRSPGIDLGIFLSIIRAMDEAYLVHTSGENKTFSREMFKR